MKTNNNTNPEVALLNEIKLRLDAILVLLLRKDFRDENGKMSLGEMVRFLHSIGFTPKDIVPKVGKKKISEIAPHLYPKKKNKK